MKKILVTLAFLAASAAVFGQDKTKVDPETGFPLPQEMEHAMTEFWNPQPKVVEPGEYVGNPAPSDAIVLFDGTNLDAWQSYDGSDAKWEVKNGAMTVVKGTGDIRTKQNFGSFQLHIEWREPKNLKGSSQERGNSGVFLQGIYEVQVLDSYNNPTYNSGGAGSIYKQSAPMANPTRKPGEWNVYDIIYNAPVFHEDGTYRVYPTVTVLFNGVLVQNNTRINGTTEWIGLPRVRPHGDGPIILQDHENPVSFRNIWIREIK